MTKRTGDELRVLAEGFRSQAANLRATGMGYKYVASGLLRDAKLLEKLAADADERAQEADRLGVAEWGKGDAKLPSGYGRERIQRDQKPLPKRDHAGTVGDVTSEEHGFAVSQGRATDKLTRYANAASFTIKTLAEAASKKLKRKVPRSGLSMARAGERPIKRDLAEAVRDLTRSEKYPDGFEVTASNWRGGIPD